MKLLKLSVIALVWSINGCSFNPSVHYDSKPNFNMDGLHNFFILQKQKQDGVYLTLDQNRAINAIDKILINKGYKSSTKEKADFIVSLQLVKEKKYRSENYYEPFGYYPFWYGFGNNNYVREYEVGTLIIDIINPNSKEVIWRGSTGSRIKKNLSPSERKARIQLAAQNILKTLS